MSTVKEHIYIVKNNTNQILYFAIVRDTDTHILHIYVAESENILKNMFAEHYYALLNPGKSMRLEAESPEAEIKSFTIAFEVESTLNVYTDFQEYVINVPEKNKTSLPN